MHISPVTGNNSSGRYLNQRERRLVERTTSSGTMSLQEIKNDVAQFDGSEYTRYV